MKQQVTVVLGSGAIAVAIARRVSVGKHVLLADLREENAEKAAQALREAGFECSIMTMDVSSRESVQVVQKLSEIGIDFIEVSGGNYESPQMLSTKDSTRKLEAFFIDYAEKARAVS